ncbi:MAG TPA: N-acetylglucosamine-6-phosphate deacetylase [Nocardioidaceae bacterium]|nr:N-acetylglucosamine-6-phosphate deacetylase [Nocardioidaceae bacterium]
MTARKLGVSAALVGDALLPGDVEVDDDRVTRVGLPPAAGSRIASPGFLDLQVNGFAGIDVMAADVDELDALGRALGRHGVTAWLPTLITAPPDAVQRALVRLGRVTAPDRRRPVGVAQPVGIHLEGPFLSPRRLGTHPPEYRRDPDASLLGRWRALAPVVAVTLAPELPGSLDLVAELAREGVLVSLGHSDATATQAHAAFDAGARSVTHLFNAMSPLHHRAPGLPGAALARQDVVVQMVVDGHHLDGDVVRTAWAAARDRVVLVTDATAAAGRGDGSFTLAGVPVTVSGGAVRNAQGALAGSALTLDAGVRNAVALGVDLVSALRAVTSTPARLLGRLDLGVIEPGARADLVVLEEDLTVRETVIGGHRVGEGSGVGDLA